MDANVVAEIPVLVVSGGVAAALAWLVLRPVFNVWTTPFAKEVWSRCRWAWRLAIAAVAALAVLPARRLDSEVDAIVEQVLVLTVVVAMTWLGLGLLRAAELGALERMATADDTDVRARRMRTRAVVLRRVGSALVVVVGLASALLTFETARAVGTSLLASAGLLGVVVGVAAQQSLRNVVAGIQIAFAEPIRLDDVVVVEGEWGTVEDITLTTVIIRVWDRRRLVYPTSWFVEHSFQNWTRQDRDLMSATTLVVDHRTDVAALRAHTAEVLASSPFWDGEEWALHVTDATAAGATVRVVATAADAQTSWELRCELREALLHWLATEHPVGLPVHRLLGGTAAGHLDPVAAPTAAAPAPSAGTGLETPDDQSDRA